MLLRFGADANARGEGGGTPLHVAADAGRTALVKALLDAGADALAQDAVRWRWQSLRRALLCLPMRAALTRTYAASQYKRVPLHRAVRNGHAATVAALLAAAPGGVDTPNENGWTPLIYAARWGHSELVAALLSAGADTTARTRDGRTALSAARDGGQSKAASLLQRAGAPGAGGDKDDGAASRHCARVCGF